MQVGVVTAVAIVMVAGIVIIPSYGQASTNTIQFSQPFASSGLPLCGGEEVFFSGIAHFLFHETIDGRGKIHTTMHMNYMESSAVSASGVPYQINEVNHFKVNQHDAGGVFHTVINGRLVSQGPGVNTGFHMVLQTVLDPITGEPKTIVERVEIDCVG